MAAGGQPPRVALRSAIPDPFPNSGFGSVLFPGTGAPPPIIPTAFPTTFVERFGSTTLGGGYTGRRRRGFYGGGGYGGYPIVWPVVVGGDYGYGAYDGGYAQQPPNITIVMPPQQTVPAVTINQYAPDQARPELREYAPQGGQASTQQPGDSSVRIYSAESSPRPAAADDQILFFVALKDSSVYTAVAYWVEDGMLHYVTPQGRHNQVSLDLVDRDVSSRLNAGRKVEFHLPAPR